jgi:hypothetical protein
MVIVELALPQAADLPHIGLDTTGMAVTIDLGDPKAPAGDVHSRVKDPVAYRLALQAMHAAYAYQEGENVTNHDHPELTPHPFALHFTGPLVSEAALLGGSQVVVLFDHGEGLYLNDTMGCDIHRGVNFAGQPIGGECCRAQDTFQVRGFPPLHTSRARSPPPTLTTRWDRPRDGRGWCRNPALHGIAGQHVDAELRQRQPRRARRR